MPESPGTRRDSRLRSGKVQNKTGGSRRQQKLNGVTALYQSWQYWKPASLLGEKSLVAAVIALRWLSQPPRYVSRCVNFLQVFRLFPLLTQAGAATGADSKGEQFKLSLQVLSLHRRQG